MNYFSNANAAMGRQRKKMSRHRENSLATPAVEESTRRTRTVDAPVLIDEPDTGTLDSVDDSASDEDSTAEADEEAAVDDDSEDSIDSILGANEGDSEDLEDSFQELGQAPSRPDVLALRVPDVVHVEPEPAAQLENPQATLAGEGVGVPVVSLEERRAQLDWEGPEIFRYECRPCRFLLSLLRC